MAEVKFGAEATGPTKGDEAIIESIEIVEDGKLMRVTATAEQAEAVRKLMGEETKPELTPEEKAAAEKEKGWLGDFADGAALRKSYDEIRTKMSESKTPEEKAAAAKAVEDADAAAKAKGVDMQKYVEEWGVNKSISDESYVELGKAGFTKEIVDGYIAGRISVVEKQTATLYEAVGGEESYGTLLEWGKANLPKESQQAYDRLLNAGDYEAATLALRGFMQQYTAAEGSVPGGIEAGAKGDPTQGAAKPFATKTEQNDAINDRRYKTGDKAYVKSVEARMLATDVSKLMGA